VSYDFLFVSRPPREIILSGVLVHYSPRGEGIWRLMGLIGPDILRWSTYLVDSARRLSGSGTGRDRSTVRVALQLEVILLEGLPILTRYVVR